MRNEVLLGDCREVLATLDDASVDAIVTDPPYALTQVSRGGSRRTNDPSKPYGRHRLADKGFMGRQWDNGLVAHDPAFWAEVRRVAKPGAFLLAFAGTRTYHRLACAIEDAGWELRDMLMWLYGSGFPKSKSCLKPAQEPIVLAKAPGPLQPLQIDACRVPTGEVGTPRAYEPRQDRAQWRITGGSNGSGATSPAGRWPPNVLYSHHPDCQPAGVRRVRGAGWRDTHGTTEGKVLNGAIWGNRSTPLARLAQGHHTDADGYETVDAWTCHPSCPIRLLDEQAGPRSVSGSARNGRPSTAQPQSIFGGPRPQGALHDDAGSASRFFPTFTPDTADAVPFRYVPKASPSERLLPDGTRHRHPTTKPLALMHWLVRLVTPAGGVVLDPFCGSGTTLVACAQQGFGFIGIDAEPEYVEIARARLAATLVQPPLPALTAGAGRL